MKKTAFVGVLLILSFLVISCGSDKAPVAGSATPESMLGLLPSNVQNVFVVDVRKAMSTDAAKKALEDEEMNKHYQEFVEKSGVDFKNDVYYFVLGIAGGPEFDAQKQGLNVQNGAVLVNLKYDKENLLALLKENAKDLKEEDYNGVTLYSGSAPTEAMGAPPQGAGAFLDASNIVLGDEASVREVIDIYQKKSESILTNKAMTEIFKAVDTSALFWGAFSIPANTVNELGAGNPMLQLFEGVTALTLSFDYELEGLTAVIQALGGTQEQNDKMKDAMNGLLALAGGMTGSLPAVGALLETIEITSAADRVKISALVPSELIEELQQAAKAKAGEILEKEI